MSRDTDRILDAFVASGAMSPEEMEDWFRRKRSSGMTVREALDPILARWASHPKHDWTAKHYAASIRQFIDGLPRDEVNGLEPVAGLGDQSLSTIELRDLEIHATRVRRYLGERKVQRAQLDAAPLFTYDARSHGGGSERMLIELMRKYFATAAEMRLVASNPALGLAGAKEDPDPVKTYSSPQQIQDVFNICLLMHDPELYRQLNDMSFATGWRSHTAINLRCANIEVDSRRIEITEKGDKTRMLPVSEPRLRRLLAFARSRGASRPTDHVFLSLEGDPITRKHFENFYERVKKECDWARPHQYGMRWNRQLLAQAAAELGGWGVAVALLGHSVNAAGTTHKYVPKAASYPKVVATIETILGPLETAEPFWMAIEPDYTGLFPVPTEGSTS